MGASAPSKLCYCWKALYDWSSSLLDKMMIRSPQETAALEPPNPSKKPQVVYSIGPCGGNGGAARDAPADPRTRILKVMLRHGKTIDAIRVLHQRDYGGGGPAEWSEWWGGGGGQTSEFSLGEGEHLTCVSGHYGTLRGGLVIRSLKFTTDSGATHGPYGAEEGTSFKLDAQGGRIVGFFGRSALFLDAIGIYTVAAAD